MEIDHILEQCEGACGITDDIIISAKDEEEHYRNFINFMRVVY